MTTKKDITRSYDQYAKKWAKRIRSIGITQKDGGNPVHRYLEKPAMYAALSNIDGKHLLCVGCGSGEECDFLSSLGAKVTGIDISEELVKIAKDSFPQIEFEPMDMENLKFDENTFDIVYSSYTMHYLKHWTQALTEAKRVLRPGGIIQFSTHHPIKWAGKTERNEDYKSFVIGYKKYSDGIKSEVYGDYLNTREVKDTWFGDFKVTYYHKPISEIFSEIRNVGLDVVDFLEPRAVDDSKEEYKQFWDVHSKIPHCMIFILRKPYD